MKRPRALVLDMDGVLWRGETPLPGLNELFATLARLELPFVLATNNATKSASSYVEKLGRFGVALSEAQVLTSAAAAARYLRERFPRGSAVYAVGEAGLRGALEAEGFRIVPAAAVRSGARPPVVVCGLAQASLDYESLAMATLALRAGAAFVATNADATLPSELGPLPGAGAILALLKTAAGRDPIVVGKPARPLFEGALERLGTPPEATLMVGDRLETDIAGARRLGLRTVLLLTGVAQREDLPGSPAQPDLVLEDLPALCAWLEAQPVGAD